MHQLNKNIKLAIIAKYSNLLPIMSNSDTAHQFYLKITNADTDQICPLTSHLLQALNSVNNDDDDLLMALIHQTIVIYSQNKIPSIKLLLNCKLFSKANSISQLTKFYNICHQLDSFDTDILSCINFVLSDKKILQTKRQTITKYFIVLFAILAHLPIKESIKSFYSNFKAFFNG